MTANHDDAMAPLVPPLASGRAQLLRALRTSVAAVADEWAARSTAAKGWQRVPHALAEEWASGPLPVARFLARLAWSPPPVASPPVAHTAAGLAVYAVPPIPRLGDGLAMRGYRAFIHAEPGNGLPAASPAVTPAVAGIALVLGAGNVTATPVLDVLDQVFVHHRAVVLKLSPLHQDLAAPLSQALAPLVAAHHLLVVTGSAELGARLAAHAAITAVHLTGSSDTWAALRATPVLQTKHLSAEVGCCTPAFVLPGLWRDGELRHVARQLAAFVAMNGGATCVAPRVLLTAASWPQRAALLTHLQRELAALPARVPFHGSVAEHFALATGLPVRALALAPTLCADRDERRHGDLCGRELFAPVLREFPRPGNEVVAFAHSAAQFVRERCFGALSAYVFAPPRGLRTVTAAMAQLIDSLPHGTIAINTWTGLGYGLGTTPWGVPKHSDLAHGSGWTRNVSGLLHPHRVVIEAPFRPHPLPPWLPQHRRAAATMRALTLHTLRPSLRSLAVTAANAMASF